MSEEEQYLEGLLGEIERRKSEGSKYLYRINSKITNEVAHYVENYFKDNPSYIIETRYCMSCKGTWDIIITFR